MACSVRRVENFIVENGEVEGKTQPDGVGSSKLTLSDFGGLLVCLVGRLGGGLALVSSCIFCNVSVIVTFPGLDNGFSYSFFLSPRLPF